MGKTWIGAACCVLLAVACAQSPTGHPQLLLVSDAEMAQMGVASFDDVKRETPPTTDKALSAYVECIANAITREAAPNTRWEVVVFQSDDVNAFALPGGKIGVYTGILKAAQDQDELATVLGHEVAHVIAKHGNARVSAALAAQTGVQLTAAAVGGSAGPNREVAGLLGLGTELGVLLPYSREQETEADELGLQYMANAGFQPKAAVELWQNMQRIAGDKMPTFLSTHPSNAARIADIGAKVPAATRRYEAARQAGKTPQCRR
jgi:predicted Zn-dependent protease